MAKFDFASCCSFFFFFWLAPTILRELSITPSSTCTTSITIGEAKSFFFFLCRSFFPPSSSPSYLSCSKFAYFGDGADISDQNCSYPEYESHGGDCANFISQALVVGGGHHPIKGHPRCRGYPCGVEEPSGANLDFCLSTYFGWHRECGYQLKAPSWLSVGDVIIFHKESCDGMTVHSTIVTQVEGDFIGITCHSQPAKNAEYSYYLIEHPYASYLRKPSASFIPGPTTAILSDHEKVHFDNGPSVVAEANLGRNKK